MGDASQSDNDRLRKELEQLRKQHEEQRKRLHTQKLSHADALKRLAQSELSIEIDRVHALSMQLGHCKSLNARLGPSQNTTWTGGDEEEDIRRVRARIEEDAQDIKKERGGLSKTDAGETLDLKKEILQHRTSHLTKERQDLKDREFRLETSRIRFLKRKMRLEAAMRSNFRDLSMMDDRYQPLNMIGHGGFGEVYRAYDLESNSYCAIKIFDLDKQHMTEAQRENFVERAKRELDILKNLKHQNIVTMKSHFCISDRVLCFALELCTGGTLSAYLEQFTTLNEKDSKGIVIQVLNGLKYLNANETGKRFIHYDLKPANLLFHSGMVKIADFGLSKIVHQNSCGDSIDLTSQGTGTYWYLPPEVNCEPNLEEPPKISNKVDVWSTGVIFFEMLSGKRPYGHGYTQDAFRRQVVVQGFENVELPLGVKVSTECREYVKRLLCLDKEKRPDVVEAASDPYLITVSKS